ncbi:MAG: hypothetical protein ABI769_01915 [Pseudomonadota bacterium]
MPNIWPFHKKAKPVPEAVNELSLVNADGSPANFPQYWKRNTLVIDLSGAGGTGMGATGSFAAKLPEETAWPVRVAVRVRPGSVGQVEVQGEERAVFPVTNEGTLPIDLQLAPSVYTPKTAAIYISWGPLPVFAEAAPAAEEPVFVSPTVVPKSGAEAAPPEATPSANDIIPPAEAKPVQPSPPPGN